MSDPDQAALWTLPEALAWGQWRDPPDAFRDFLETLHELCRSGRVQAFGLRQTESPRNTLEPIPASDWIELYFDSDGKQLRSGDLFSGILHNRRAWTSVRFSQADLIREWPKAGAAAFATEQANKYWANRFRGRSNRSIQERWRRGWIDRFAAKQREIRRWIPFVEIADACARAASPVTIAEEDGAHALAYRRLVDSIARGEFERNGASWVLMLFPKLVVPVPPHRLTQKYFRAMVDAYGAADFSSTSRLVREKLWFCWLPSELCRKWFERHHLIWPDDFNAQGQMVGVLPRSPETIPKTEISEPQVPDAVAPKKGKRGRKTGSGSFDDDEAPQEMLQLFANGEAASVNAAALHVAPSNTVKKTGTEESAARRLGKKFADKYGTDPPSGKTWSHIAGELETK